jgi:hypothetical protein
LLDTANTFTGGVQQITTASAATKGLIIKATASQTANLFEVQNSSSTVLSQINKDGSAFFGLTTSNYPTYFGSFISGAGMINAVPASAAVIGLIIRGAASQTANLQEWQNSAGTVLASVASTGNITSTSGIDITANSVFRARFTVGASAFSTLGQFVVIGFSGRVGVVVQATGADSQQWQNSSSTVLTAITSAGTINFASGNTSATATAGAVTLPALAVGFITMQVAGTTVKVPYYAN